MSKLKNTFGFTGSLLDTIKAVHEAAKAPGTEAREKITNVPRKAGDEDLRARQGEIQRKIVDEGLKGNQDKIDVAKPKGKITAADFAKLRTMKKKEVESVDEAMKEKEVASSYYKSTPEGKSEARNKSKSAARLSAVADKLKQRYGEPKKTNEEVEELDELSLDTLEKYKRKAGSDIRDRIAKFQTPDRNKKTNKRIGGYRTAWQKIENKYDGKEEVEYDYDIALDEEDKTYPYKASQLTPVMVQLRSLIKFLSRSGVLKNLMREEHHALYEVFMEQEFDANELQNILEEIEDLLEGRPKGSKNKPKGEASTSSEAPKSSASHDSDDEPPAYKSASGHDSGHIMAQLAGASDVGGRHISTAKGHKYVSGQTASKIHSHLMGLKAPDRAEASSRIYHMDDSHPAVKAIHADHEASVKRGVAVPGEKRGRGRPKKTA